MAKPDNKPLVRELASTQVRAVGDGDDRRFLMSFSSEEPVQCWFGLEILDHSEGAADLSRLQELGIVLFNHNRDSILGKPLNVTIADGRGTAELVFDDDEFAQSIREKVINGTLKGVSVSYRVDVWEEVEAGATSTDGRFEGPVWIARKWTPLEISIVSVPADATVGVGRSIEEDDNLENTMQPDAHAGEEMRGGAAPAATPVTTPEAAPPAADNNERAAEKAAQAERQRAADIMAMCRSFGMDATEYITAGTSVEEAQRSILDELAKERQAIPGQVTEDEADKFIRSASDALLLRGGINVEKPIDGANELRGMSLDLMLRACAQRSGENNSNTMSPDELMRQYFTPESAFASLMDNTIQKAVVAGYELAPTTFELWTAEGTLTNFRINDRNYRRGEAGRFLHVPEGGEIKHDRFADELLPQRQLNTYGRQFTLSRQAIIDDDIDLVTSLPQQYAQSSRLTINEQVYNIIANNLVIYDGTPLFSAAHGNLVAAPGSAPDRESIQAIIKMFGIMRNNDGRAIRIVPRFIIVPLGMGMDVEAALASHYVGNIENNVLNMDANPLARLGLTVIEDPDLNVLSTNGQFEWYIAADRTSVPAIQVDYYNGIKIPHSRTMEYPGQLGMIWDFWLDWGVTVMDYRGIIKNPGNPA